MTGHRRPLRGAGDVLKDGPPVPLLRGGGARPEEVNLTGHPAPSSRHAVQGNASLRRSRPSMPRGMPPGRSVPASARASPRRRGPCAQPLPKRT